MKQTLPYFVLFVFAGSAGASELLYSFDFTQGASPTVTVESFAFSFTVPTFVTGGESPAFTPFALTDGTHSSPLLTSDLFVTSPTFGGCIEIASSPTELGGDCSISLPGPTGGAMVFSSPAAPPLPSALGHYHYLGVGGFFIDSKTIAFAGGDVNLTISSVSEVPEPSFVVLLAAGLAALCVVQAARANARRATARPVT